MPKRLSMLLEYQKCRARGHAWDDFVADRRTHPVIYESPYQETLLCIRCETERYRGIGYTGEVESNNYDYPDGYLMSAEDRPEIVAVRLSLVTEIKAATAQARRSQAHRRQARQGSAHKKTARKGTARRAAPRRRARTRV